MHNFSTHNDRFFKSREGEGGRPHTHDRHLHHSLQRVSGALPHQIDAESNVRFLGSLLNEDNIALAQLGAVKLHPGESSQPACTLPDLTEDVQGPWWSWLHPQRDTLGG